MNSADYTFLLNQPAAVNDRQTDALEKIVAEFPYFQSARALRLKGLYSQNSFQYNFALKVTAAYTTDRSVLFDFITSDSFTTINKGLYDQKLAELHAIDVKESEIVLNQNNEPTVDKVEQSILSSIKESESLSEAIDTPQAQVATESILSAQPEEQHLEVSSAMEESSVSEQVAKLQMPAVNIVEEIEFVPIQQQPGELKNTDIDETADAFTETAVEQSIVEETEDSSVAETEEIPEQNLNAVELIEAKLHIGEPLEFSKTETHSFQEWLLLSRLKPINREEDPPKPEPTPDPTGNGPNPPDDPIVLGNAEPHLDKVKKNQLIDRFIETNPKIPPMKPDIQPAIIDEPKEDHSALMTETLARVYLEQKKYQKAIQAYEILILKYPEKSSFFADRISEIKNLQ